MDNQIQQLPNELANTIASYSDWKELVERVIESTCKQPSVCSVRNDKKCQLFCFCTEQSNGHYEYDSKCKVDNELIGVGNLSPLFYQLVAHFYQQKSFTPLMQSMLNSHSYHIPAAVESTYFNDSIHVAANDAVAEQYWKKHPNTRHLIEPNEGSQYNWYAHVVVRAPLYKWIDSYKASELRSDIHPPVSPDVIRAAIERLNTLPLADENGRSNQYSGRSVSVLTPELIAFFEYTDGFYIGFSNLYNLHMWSWELKDSRIDIEEEGDPVLEWYCTIGEAHDGRGVYLRLVKPNETVEADVLQVETVIDFRSDGYWKVCGATSCAFIQYVCL